MLCTYRLLYTQSQQSLMSLHYFYISKLSFFIYNEMLMSKLPFFFYQWVQILGYFKWLEQDTAFYLAFDYKRIPQHIGGEQSFN